MNLFAVNTAFGKAFDDSHSGLCSVPDASTNDDVTEAVSTSMVTLLLANWALSKLIWPLNFLKEPRIWELSWVTLNEILLCAGMIFHGVISAALMVVLKKSRERRVRSFFIMYFYLLVNH